MSRPVKRNVVAKVSVPAKPSQPDPVDALFQRIKSGSRVDVFREVLFLVSLFVSLVGGLVGVLWSAGTALMILRIWASQEVLVWGFWTRIGFGMGAVAAGVTLVPLGLALAVVMIGGVSVPYLMLADYIVDYVRGESTTLKYDEGILPGWQQDLVHLNNGAMTIWQIMWRRVILTIALTLTMMAVTVKLLHALGDTWNTYHGGDMCHSRPECTMLGLAFVVCGVLFGGAVLLLVGGLVAVCCVGLFIGLVYLGDWIRQPAAIPSAAGSKATEAAITATSNSQDPPATADVKVAAVKVEADGGACGKPNQP
jgi:hypothetical protein